MNYVLIYTIGPVQRFIQAARKTQDLFAGSAILSFLSREAFFLLKEMIENEGGSCELIFPAFREPNSNPGSDREESNPNRFAVVVKNIKADDLRRVVSAVKKLTIEEKFADTAYRRIEQNLPDNAQLHFNTGAQLKNILEIHWGALPLAQDNSNYHEQYNKLESYLGGIKNIRVLNQLTEAGRKCSVDGVHNIVLYRKSFPSSQAGSENSYKLHLDATSNNVMVLDSDDEKYAKIWHISPGEGLSAISLYKRMFFDRPHQYPSTARVALMHILDNEEIKSWAEFQSLDRLIGSGGSIFPHSDDQLFYRENINPSLFRKRKSFASDMELEEAINRVASTWEKFSDKLEKFSFPPLTSKYYAVLTFDGDGMGKVLGGARLSDKRQLKSYQMKLRDALAEFSDKAREILTTPHGKVVYAAGEDFLGFVNLNSIFIVLAEMRKSFDEIVSKTLLETSPPFQLNDKSPITFSAGIAISHYKQPLPTALAEARRAERKAKEEGGDRFCISIMRHSGGTTRTVLPFGENSEKNLEALKIVVQKLQLGEFSNTFIHQLIREMRHWESVDSSLFEIEAARLMGRSLNLATKPTESPEAFGERRSLACTEMRGAVLALSRATSIRESDAIDLTNTLSALRIADFIQRNQSQA